MRSRSRLLFIAAPLKDLLPSLRSAHTNREYRRKSEELLAKPEMPLDYVELITTSSEVKKRGWTMIVTTQNKGRSGRSVTGLYIGLGNVRRHFSEGVRTIELELEDLRIECELKASFWRDQPEITDPRLCAWLKAKNARRESRRAPARVGMFPAGKRSFKLQLVRSEWDGEYSPHEPAAWME